MDDVDDAGFERWFSAVRNLPESAADVTAVFESITDNVILDLLREARADSSSDDCEWISF